MTLNLLRNV